MKMRVRSFTSSLPVEIVSRTVCHRLLSTADKPAETQEKMTLRIANGAQIGWLVDAYGIDFTCTWRSLSHILSSTSRRAQVRSLALHLTSRVYGVATSYGASD